MNILGLLFIVDLLIRDSHLWSWAMTIERNSGSAACKQIPKIMVNCLQGNSKMEPFNTFQ